MIIHMPAYFQYKSFSLLDRSNFAIKLSLGFTTIALLNHVISSVVFLFNTVVCGVRISEVVVLQSLHVRCFSLPLVLSLRRLLKEIPLHATYPFSLGKLCIRGAQASVGTSSLFFQFCWGRAGLFSLGTYLYCSYGSFASLHKLRTTKVPIAKLICQSSTQQEM